MAPSMPATRPTNPRFSSGPCAKPPGWSLDALKGASLGRFHVTDLQVQMRLVVLLVAAGAAATLIDATRMWPRGLFQNFDITFALMWLAGCGCAIGAAVQAKYHRFAALALLAPFLFRGLAALRKEED